MLAAKDLTVRFGNLCILDKICFSVFGGEWLMICGPNGAGKSTLINAVSQSAKYTGLVEFKGRDLKKCKPRDVAKNIGVLMQNNNVNYSFTVREIVRMGRYAYSEGILSKEDALCDEMTERAMEMTGISKLAEHSTLTLSGGELQRTFLAQLFAQDPQILMLDEPTNHLDLQYQKQTFELIQKWIEETGRAVISVVHDLSLARAYGTSALLMDGGKVVAHGAVKETLTRENLEKAYSMDVYGWMRSMLSQWN